MSTTFTIGEKVYLPIAQFENNGSTQMKYVNAYVYKLFTVTDVFDAANSRYSWKSGENRPGFKVDRVNINKWWYKYPNSKQLYVYADGDEQIDWSTEITVTNVINSPDSRQRSSIGDLKDYTVNTSASKYASGAKYVPFEPGARVQMPATDPGSLGGVAIYAATDQFAFWKDLGQANLPNPYEDKQKVQLWTRISSSPTSLIYNSTSIDGRFYWRHPVQNVMYLAPKGIYTFTPLDNIEYLNSLEEGKIRALMNSGMSRQSAEAVVNSLNPTYTRGSGTGTTGVPGGGSSGGTSGAGGSGQINNGEVKATVKIRGNFGFVGGAEPEGSEPQMVQYYKTANSILQEPARHFFRPKPNQINYQNLGSEWTEIERVGRIPLVDWKNFKLMKISFQFMVIPDETYRLGAFGNTADDGITLTVDSQLENLRNMAARPFPIILYGFDDLLRNANPFSMSAGSGVQFVITDLSISSMIRTPQGNINRATCDITLQEVPLEYITLISLPSLPTVREIPVPKQKQDEIEYGSNPLLSKNLNDVTALPGTVK